MVGYIQSVRGQFHGLYEHGKGWVSDEVYRKWNEFWRTQMSSIRWKYYSSRGDSSDYLFSMGGSVYLHPLYFNAILSNTTGVEFRGKYVEEYSRELHRLCNECAEYCGGTFTMSHSEEQRVVMNDNMQFVNP